MSTEPRGTFCLACNALGNPDATSCWMCGSTELRNLGPVAPVGAPAPPAEKDAATWYLGDELHRPRSHSMPSYVKPVIALISVILGACFLIGLWQESPGLAVVLALVVGVGIRATVGLGKPSGDPGTAAAGTILRVFGTVATVVSTVILIFVVGMVAMFCFALITCLGMLKGG